MLTTDAVIEKLRTNLRDLLLDPMGKADTRIDDIAKRRVDAEAVRKYAREIVHQRGWICQIRWQVSPESVDMIVNVFADDDAWQDYLAWLDCVADAQAEAQAEQDMERYYEQRAEMAYLSHGYDHVPF